MVLSAHEYSLLFLNRNTTSKTTLLVMALVLFAQAVHAQGQSTPPPAPISDNSFLIEEAYNQEPGVVQHINTFTRSKGGGWIYTFTQEWPVKSMKHQLSYTLTVLNAANNPDVHGLGDIALNYRYQVVANDKVAVAPRASLLLPTGSATKELGVGGVGFQTNLPHVCSYQNRCLEFLRALKAPAEETRIGL